MLHKETVESSTLDLIITLMRDPAFQQFRLVGGTALALMIGHRISVDIDMFSEISFDAKKVANHTQTNYQVDNLVADTNSLSCFINDIKFDCISHRYPWVGDCVYMEDLRLCSIEDIAAMKVNAIVGNGTRYKDFVDIYFILEHLSLREITQSFIHKYPAVTEQMALLSITYFDDVIVPKNLFILDQNVNWDTVKNRITQAEQDMDKVFDIGSRYDLNDENHNSKRMKR